MTAKKEAKPAKAPKAAVEKAPKVVRERQNGHTRPISGTKTGVVWDLADSISQKMKRPALRNEVFDAYEKAVKDPSFLTAGTQYSRWCAFHKVAAELKKFKTEANKAQDEAKAKAKAEKKAAAEKVKADKAAKAAAVQKKAA